MSTSAERPTPQPKDFVARHTELKQGFRTLHRELPGPMAGFNSLHAAAVQDGVLTRATKELIALAIGICGHCDGCIAFHVHDALKAGATRAEVEEAIGVAILMGGGGAAVYASDAMTALDQFETTST
ncbi:MAG: carboxymuconolactone decarboxylase family protein [Acidimicrobiia bacterium]|nr:carboxymuconolactone decarboxylase family protein [Acidimicrobiia bacterium]